MKSIRKIFGELMSDTQIAKHTNEQLQRVDKKNSELVVLNRFYVIGNIDYNKKTILFSLPKTLWQNIFYYISAFISIPSIMFMIKLFGMAFYFILNKFNFTGGVWSIFDFGSAVNIAVSVTIFIFFAFKNFNLAYNDFLKTIKDFKFEE